MSSSSIQAYGEDPRRGKKWHQDYAQKYNMPIIQDMDGVVMIWIRSEINLQLMQSITFYIS